MIIEITGVGTDNKGAELMFVAIQRHFGRRGGGVHLAAAPGFGTYHERAHYGLLQKVAVNRWGRSRIGFTLLPGAFRANYGMVTEDGIDAVIDASGFAFGDQHPASRTLRFAEDVRRWKQQGKAVVLLPQALGPFESEPHRAGFQEIVRHADLVYARDRRSLEHAREAVGPAETLRLAPDSNGVQHGTYACIVPNSRMLDKVSPDRADRYVPFLARCIEAVAAAGVVPRLLIHDDREDEALIEPIRRALGRPVEVVQKKDPLALKAVLGGARFVVGSRFHALVGALSQGVPCIATGWSHKYEMLFHDFGCEGLILPVSAGQAEIDACIDAVAGAGRGALVRRIEERGGCRARQVGAMWDEVDAVLGLPVATPGVPA